ncbi:MAG: hypothetical protein NT030_08715, partial [Candidatus Saganbacteria bacterium]|nr:hypothetical protein [Candidatus Saganbacteria bacterium]
GELNIGLGYNQSWYGFMSKWTRLTHNIVLSRDFQNGYDGYIGHMHYILFDGDSIFRYESYKVIPSDEFSFGLGYNFGPHRIGFDYSYFVPDWDQKEFIYTLTLGFHCYSVDIKYNTAMQQLMFGVNLITR